MISLEQIEGAVRGSPVDFSCLVNPADDNLETFGGAIRDIIILACTEVEAQWKGVLEAHNVNPINGRQYNTRDYVKLLPAMRLDAYEVKLIRIPDCPTGPFIRWNADEPTSLSPVCRI